VYRALGVIFGTKCCCQTGRHTHFKRFVWIHCYIMLGTTMHSVLV